MAACTSLPSRGPQPSVDGQFEPAVGADRICQLDLLDVEFVSDQVGERL
ncbi:isoleucyl-tRNA synthetase domain protein [Mycobacterium ulcerans str. Harvey]|uniref:Isoleucyl-tRNA synthetase domain protein n=1 Tax=Mycobacterium ulcerans str. Harvey TaxID=1299332 RepID=A0ABN0R1G8_MYCUL|nr:isoleucyl-tRNA synthetase domain protein [Mycobacterium ulcerans str. Harvey]